MKTKTLLAVTFGALFAMIASVFSAGFFSRSSTVKAGELRQATKQTADTPDTKYLTNAVDIKTDDASLKMTINSFNSDNGVSLRVTYSTDNDYILGYYGEGDENRPLSCQYQVTYNNEKVTKYKIFDLVQTNRNFDGIGPSVGGISSRFDYDFVLLEGETIDYESITLFNVFPALTNVNPDTHETTFTPDFTKPLKIQSFGTVTPVALGNYFSFELTSISTFGNYVSFNSRFTCRASEFYQLMKETQYKKVAEKVEAGTAYVGFQFTTISSSYFYVTYEDGSYIRINGLDNTNTAIYSFKQDGIYTLNYLLKDIPMEGITGFYITSQSISLNVYATDTDKVLNSSGGAMSTNRFGAVYFRPANSISYSQVQKINVVLILFLAELIFTAVYAIISLIVYFVSKEKFKNDEFRRMNTKAYVKTDVLGYLALALLLFDVMTIIFRSSLLNNCYVTYNPSDNFIVFVSIALIFFIGYFIKFFIAMFKNFSARRQARRLHLDQDKADDGTN